MGLFKGGALRLFQTFLYALLFCCAAIILGIFSYFLSVLADRNAPIADWKSAVEGLSGAATLYLIFAVLLTCCFGGITFLAILAIILDILFCGAMIAIAVLTRHGANSCSGYVRTPLGNGQANSGSGSFGGDITYRVSLRTACELNTACFAVAIIGAFLFLCTAALQILLMRHHKKEKRYGPGPDNNYTEGSGKKTRQYPMWRRKPRAEVNRDAELGTVPVTGTTAAGLAADHQDIRPSHETGYTGSTAAGEAVPYEKIDPQHHRGTSTHAPHGTHGGYYTQPQGTGVNPYGYETAAPTTYTTGTATNY